MPLSPWQWLLLGLGAFCSGLAKTGVAGLGVLTVAFFANALPARESTGALLPLLLCGDIFGVSFYRKHASWKYLWKLFPWVAIGVFIGFLALDHVNNHQMQRIIGVILLVMVALHLWRQKRGDNMDAALPHTWWFGAITGLLAGFTTMVANAAGPVMILYFLALGLPKLVFIGTSAWFYFVVNLFKVPFSMRLGLITGDSLRMDAFLLIPMIPGALLGPLVIRRMDQRTFEGLALVLTVVASAKLLM
jgi:uncharacterized membrane protein YfcA